MDKAPFRVRRVSDDWSFPWHLVWTDGRPYGFVSRHRTEEAAKKALVRAVKAWARPRGVTTSLASMGAMAPPVY